MRPCVFAVPQAEKFSLTGEQHFAGYRIANPALQNQSVFSLNLQQKQPRSGQGMRLFLLLQGGSGKFIVLVRDYQTGSFGNEPTDSITQSSALRNKVATGQYTASSHSQSDETGGCEQARELLSAIWSDDAGERVVFFKDAATGQKRHLWFPDTEQALERAASLKDKGDVWYGISLFRDTTSRKVENVLTSRALYLDLDVGHDKPYMALDEARAELNRFCKETGLPLPVIVCSGYGLHCYWPLDRALSSAEWLPLAQSFKAACRKHSLHADEGITTDFARVLRVPGTLNFKDAENPQPCRLLTGVTVFETEVIKRTLSSLPLDAGIKDLFGGFSSVAEEANKAFAVYSDDPQRDRETAKECLSYLNKERSDEYDGWLNVGIALYNSFGGDDEGLDLWREWSKHSGKYVDGVCDEKWETFSSGSGRQLHVGSLVMWAREDNAEYREREETRRSARRVEAAERRAEELGLNDLGNARRLIIRHGENILYDYKRKMWLTWNGACWIEGECDVMQAAKDTARYGMATEAATIDDHDERKKMYEHAARSQSERAVRAMVNLAKSEPEIQADVAAFDIQLHLFNVANGTLDLRTGDLLPHSRTDRLTKQVPIDYDPRAMCPQTDAFLHRIFAGNQSLTSFFWRMLGYILTGETGEQCAFIFHGGGANGKSVALNLIAALTGAYGTSLRAEALMQHKLTGASGHNEDIANLRGARFVATAETDAGQRLNESLLKQLTGGDSITASRKHEHGVTFRPTFKLCLASNNKPEVEGTDEGIWRRMRLIPFDVTIPEAERDPQLLEKLTAELAGVLARAVRGAVEYYRNGLGIPPEVKQATAAYREEQDTVAAFVAEMCETGDGKTATAQQLHSLYEMWCQGSGERPKSMKAFAALMKARGYVSKRTERGMMWQGITPKPLMPLA